MHTLGEKKDRPTNNTIANLPRLIWKQTGFQLHMIIVENTGHMMSIFLLFVARKRWRHGGFLRGSPLFHHVMWRKINFDNK
jgi:hypothetical protein